MSDAQKSNTKEEELYRRYVAIRSVWETALNFNGTIEECSKEVFYLIGDLLAGKSIYDLAPVKLNKAKILEHYESHF